MLLVILIKGPKLLSHLLCRVSWLMSIIGRLSLLCLQLSWCCPKDRQGRHMRCCQLLVWSLEKSIVQIEFSVYAILTKREQDGWISTNFCCCCCCVFIDHDEFELDKNAKKSPISCSLDRTSLFNKG